LYGNTTTITENAVEISGNIKWMLAIVTIMIIVFGVYPQPMIDLTKDTVQALIK
jgi:NADH-quinone oxidoreductase subunit M